MTGPIMLLATYFRAITDCDGETKLTLLIPESHTAQTHGIPRKCVLRVTIEQDKEEGA